MAQIKDLKRMCEAYNNCKSCPLSCKSYTPPYELPDNTDEIVDKWVKEHPAKTYAMDFFEKFPNAPKEYDGIPVPCITGIYGDDKRLKECAVEGNLNCLECWNREMKGE